MKRGLYYRVSLAKHISQRKAEEVSILLKVSVGGLESRDNRAVVL